MYPHCLIRWLFFPLLLVALLLNIAQAEIHEYRPTLTLPLDMHQVPIVKPSDIVVAPDGSIWVLSSGDDNSSAAIQHFSAEGRLLAQVILDRQDQPLKIALAEDGGIWFDSRSGIKHVSLVGEVIQHSNSLVDTGFVGDNTSLSVSVSIAIATDGTWWILHQGLKGVGGIRHVNRKGELLAVIIPNDWVESFSLATDGSLWLSSGDRSLKHYSANGALLNTIVDASQSQIMTINLPADGSIWLMDNLSRLIHLNTDGQVLARFQANGFAFAGSSDGTIWIADTMNDRIQHLTSDGQLTNFDPGVIRLSSPVVAKDGSLWAVNTINQRILHLNVEGGVIGYLSPQDNCLEQRNYQRKLSLAPDGSLWVLDNYEIPQSEWYDDRWNFHYYGCIQHFTNDGKLLKQVKLYAPSIAVYGYPDTPRLHLATAPDGSIWLVNNSRLQFGAENYTTSRLLHFSAEWEKLGEFNISSDNLIVGDIQAFKIAPDGSLWLLRMESNRVQHVSTNGTVLSEFGSSGRGIGQYNFKSGGDIALAQDGSLWVADNVTNRIQHVSNSGQFIEQFEILTPNTNGPSVAQITVPGIVNVKKISSIVIGSDASVWVALTNFWGTLGLDYEYKVMTELEEGVLQKFTPQTGWQVNVAYDPQSPLVPIHDVQIAGQHYQATLQAFGVEGKFALHSFNFANNHYAPSATYDGATGILTLPQVAVDGKNYRAILKSNQDAEQPIFEILDATPLETTTVK